MRSGPSALLEFLGELDRDMSAKWIGYFFDETDLKDTELTLALAIADHADASGLAYPGIKRLADKIRRTPRQTKRLIHALEKKKYIEITRKHDDRRCYVYQLRKVASGCHQLDAGIDDTQMPPISLASGDISQPEKVTSGDKIGDISDHSLYKEEPFKPIKKPKETKSRDSRSDHAAITMVREITGRFPNRGLWTKIIEDVGENPDTNFFRHSYETWLTVGGNPQNFARWLFEPAKTGLPPEVYGPKSRNANTSTSNASKRTDADILKASAQQFERDYGAFAAVTPSEKKSERDESCELCTYVDAFGETNRKCAGLIDVVDQGGKILNIPCPRDSKALDAKGFRLLRDIRAEQYQESNTQFHAGAQ